MPTLITSKIKDDTLEWLCKNVTVGQMSFFENSKLLTHTNVDFGTLEAVLYHFKAIGLIGKFHLEYWSQSAIFLKVEAHNLFNRGGFTVIDALNEANIQKLLYELNSLKKQLQPDQLETIDKVTSIMSSIATVLSAFPSDK